MKNYIYLVHTEVTQDLYGDINDVMTYKLAFESEKSAIDYITKETELFRKDYEGKEYAMTKDQGSLLAVYTNGSKIEMLKMWYERIALVE